MIGKTCVIAGRQVLKGREGYIKISKVRDKGLDLVRWYQVKKRGYSQVMSKVKGFYSIR